MGFTVEIEKRRMMAEVKLPEPVRFITGILAADQQALELAREWILGVWGEADIESAVLPFEYSGYYRDEMGAGILRQFLGFTESFNREKLVERKLEANKLEQELSVTLNNGLPRPVNIDPGYLAPEKLVLASCKNFAHRIYIADGVFAEVTLLYKGGKFVSLPWTFPDYASGDYFPFLYAVRRKLMMERG